MNDVPLTILIIHKDKLKNAVRTIAWFMSGSQENDIQPLPKAKNRHLRELKKITANG
jgi:hypothetical protein